MVWGREGHFWGGHCLALLIFILRAEGNAPLIRPGNGLLAPGNTYSGDVHSVSMFRPLPEGRGIFLGGACIDSLTKYYDERETCPSLSQEMAR